MSMARSHEGNEESNDRNFKIKDIKPKTDISPQRAAPKEQNSPGECWSGGGQGGGMEGQACEVEVGLDHGMVVDLDFGAVEKTMDCGAEMGLDYEAVDETMEDLVAIGGASRNGDHQGEASDGDYHLTREEDSQGWVAAGMASGVKICAKSVVQITPLW